jgi:hypothetical protein
MSDSTTSPVRFQPLNAEEAWRLYLEATREADGDRYLHVEEAAWEQLQAVLATLPSDPVGAA